MSKIKNHVLVNGTKIGSATVISNELIGKGSCIPGTKITPTSVTFHQTDCIDTDAPRMHLALINANNDPYAGTSKSDYRLASWHFTVGYNKIIQNVPLNWKAYAQGCSSGNNTSISVEMCMYTDKEKQYQAYLNAIALYKVLLSDYNSKLKPLAHYDWTRKNCPSWLRAGKYGYSWTWFKRQLTENQTTKVYKQLANGDYNKKYKVISDTLNVRSNRPSADGTLADKEFIMEKGQEFMLGYVLNGWASIWVEGDTGYINTSSKYIKAV